MRENVRDSTHILRGLETNKREQNQRCTKKKQTRHTTSQLSNKFLIQKKHEVRINARGENSR
jgi:hypothetical protein